MRAVLKKVSADEVVFESYVPDDPECFSITLRMRIGVEESAGADDFELFVCTPKWLDVNVWGATWGRHCLIVRMYDYDLIFEAIQKKVSEIEGVNWEDLACKLARFYSWEFEDYQP
jgi:hypothetical protein